jgi:hypothetical protein
MGCRGVLQPVAAEEDLLKKTYGEDQSARRKAAAPASALLELIDGWNDLGCSIVRKGNGARRDPPTAAVLKGWDRASKTPDQAAALRDIPALLDAIRQARYCHGKGWFTLAWLFGRNADGEEKMVKLINGGYDDNGRPADEPDGLPPEPKSYRTTEERKRE